MKKNALLLFAFALLLQTTLAQKKLLTMEEAVVKQRTTLAPAKLKQLMWVKGTNNYSYVAPIETQEALVIGSMESSEPKPVVYLAGLNEALTVGGQSTVKLFPTIQWKNDKQFIFESDKKMLSYDIGSKKITVDANRDLGDGAESIDVAAKTNHVAFTLKNNLFIYDGKNNLIVTNDKDENIVNGQSVHRDEFGISKGTYWSPNGTQLAFYRMDQTMVTDYPIIDWTSRPALNVNIKYPMAGDKSHEVTVGIYNVANGKTVFIKTGC